MSRRYTCPFWAADNCKFSAEECRWAHYDTGRISRRYRQRKPMGHALVVDAVPQPPKNDDLISMSDNEEQAPETVSGNLSIRESFDNKSIVRVEIPIPMLRRQRIKFRSH